jgi:taurine dioxygenase
MTPMLRELHPCLGAELSGLDFSKGVVPEAFARVREAYERYSVVVLRGAFLNPARQVELTKCFGTPKISQRKEFHVPGHPEIGKVGNITNADGSPAAFLDRQGDLWHSDTSSDAKVDGVTMLSCVMTPAEGGDTLFCSTQVAWETLPAATQARAEGRQVVHNFNQHNDRLLRLNPGAFKPFTQEERDRWPDRVHDLVQQHPKSGRKHIFVTPTLMKSVSGLADAEAQSLVDELIAHATHPDRVYRHRWTVGDVVLCDNRATLHSATPANYKGGQRLMHRSYAYT